MPVSPDPDSAFVHLHVHTPYSFLDGASGIEALVTRAAAMGMPALAVTDHDGLYAAVQFAATCKAYGIAPIFGAELTMEDGTHLTLLAESRAGYGRLCRLITRAHQHGGRRNPRLPWPALVGPDADTGGLICLSGCRKGIVPRLVRGRRFDEAREAAVRLRDAFGPDRFYVELQDDWTPGSRRLCRTLAQLANHLGVGVVATNNVHYATDDDSVAHDILRRIATGTTVADLSPEAPLNAERSLKSAPDMHALFRWCPEAIANTLRIAERCCAEEVVPIGEQLTPAWADGDPAGELRRRTVAGARERYGQEPPAAVRRRIAHELEVITRLGFADYFLLVQQIVAWARSQGIRATGRGSAADSCVAYCLWLTDVDVISRDLPFARFLHEGKTPDIDVDFPSDRRDEVFTHIKATYGADRVARVCTFFTFLGRSAVRDVGKALALPPDVLEFLSDRIHHFQRADTLEQAFETRAELREQAHLLPRFRLLFDLCRRIAGFPRHLGSHSSGVVISRVPLDTIAPVEASAGGVLPIWTLDKDDSETVGAIKFDVLALRMLAAVADAEKRIKAADPSFDYDRLPVDDGPTYELLQSGKGIGVFQFESAAQLSLAVTLQPSEFEHLVAAVALIRPGPVRGNAVQRYVAGRHGWLRASVIHPVLEPILAKTFGCIVFQEQVDLCCAALMGISHVTAEKFRKSLVRHTKMNTLEEAERQFLEAVHAHLPEIPPAGVKMLWSQIAGWGGYGFIEGHAAAFALTGYKTAYLSLHHTAEHFAGMMNQQPMGFYSNNSLAAEVRRRGIPILPVDINRSGATCAAAKGDDGRPVLRLGINLVSGLREDDWNGIVAEREENGPYLSLLDFCTRVVLHRDRLENLILCGAFDGIEADVRRGLLFALDETLGTALHLRRQRLTPGAHLDFGVTAGLATSVAGDIPDFDAWDRYLWTWRITGITAECHVFAHLRESLEADGVLTCHAAAQQPDGERVTVAGMNIRPHRPPTRSGNPVLFTSLEDETDILQLVCFGKALERNTATLLLSPAIVVDGVIERHGVGASLRIETARPLSISRTADRPIPHVGRAAAGKRRSSEERSALVGAEHSTLSAPAAL